LDRFWVWHCRVVSIGAEMIILDGSQSLLNLLEYWLHLDLVSLAQLFEVEVRVHLVGLAADAAARGLS